METPWYKNLVLWVAVLGFGSVILLPGLLLDETPIGTVELARHFWGAAMLVGVITAVVGWLTFVALAKTILARQQSDFLKMFRHEIQELADKHLTALADTVAMVTECEARRLGDMKDRPELLMGQSEVVRRRIQSALKDFGRFRSRVRWLGLHIRENGEWTHYTTSSGPRELARTG